MLVSFMAILPRSAGAVVIHVHSGHELHTHLVSGFQEARTSLDRDGARAHEHEHPAGPTGNGHDHDGPVEGEVVLDLPMEPVATRFAVSSSLEASITASAQFSCDFSPNPVTRLVQPFALLRPPRPRSCASRSGSRLILRTSRALLL